MIAKPTSGALSLMVASRCDAQETLENVPMVTALMHALRDW